ncbi:MAG: hypothetical protein MJY90_05905 [Bacteroidaceae bacterium]|nr:hypothetical protein [Bacteroidaceae bacterium]
MIKTEKKYLTPRTMVVNVNAQQMVCTSNVESAGFDLESYDIEQDLGFKTDNHGWGNDLDW